MFSEFWSDLRFRVRAIFRRDAMERELEAELSFHIEREAEKLVRGGVSRGEALRQAHVAFGGTSRIKDDVRDTRGLSYLEIAGQNLRYAMRGLRRTPGFTAGVVLTLALGIGANAAMFDLVDRLMFRPARFLQTPDLVHRVYFRWSERGRDRTLLHSEYTRYLDLASWTHSFDVMAGFRRTELPVGEGDDTRLTPIGVVTASFFHLFDAPPALGRFFVEAEDVVPVGAPVAVLSHAFWQSRFAGRTDALGAKLRVGPVVYTIVGVAPEGFSGVSTDSPPSLWIPATAYAPAVESRRRPTDYFTQYNWSWLEIVARRKPGVTLEAATADLSNAFQQSWNAAGPLGGMRQPGLSVARPRVLVLPTQVWRGAEGRPESKVILWTGGVAVVVLLIACANVANLQLARAVARRREIAVRLALGVSRRRLLGQLLTESIVLAAMGGAVGVLVAPWGSALLLRWFAKDAGVAAGGPDPRMLAFAFLAAAVTGVLAGLAPALYAIRDRVAPALRTGARDGAVHRSRLRTFLVVFQGTLTAVLLVGAGLFVKSLANVQSMRIGYDIDPVLHVTWAARGIRLDSSERDALSRRLHEAVVAIPGVTHAARAVTSPFDAVSVDELFVDAMDSTSKLGMFTTQAATREIFATMGTRIVRGRGFDDDYGLDAPLVAVVSESMARTLWPGRDAVGQCFRARFANAPCTTVVGIAEDARQTSLTNPRALHYYVPANQFRIPSRSMFVRVDGDATHFAELVRRQLQRELPGAAYVNVRPMRQLIEPTMRSWRFGATMFLAFGALALVVAAVGLYSVIAYHVAQRRHELGVRIALGARMSDLLRLVVGEGVRFAAWGIVAGGSIAIMSGRWIEPLLFEVSPKDPTVIGSVAALLLVVAVVASGVPALRASRVDPNTALRAE